MNILSGMNCLLMCQYRHLGNSVIFVDGAYREVDEREVFIFFIFLFFVLPEKSGFFNPLVPKVVKLNRLSYSFSNLNNLVQ